MGDQGDAPAVNGMLLAGKKAGQSVVLQSGTAYEASIDVVDPDGDDLSYRWLVMRESEAVEQGGDTEVVPDVVPVTLVGSNDGRVSLEAPAEPGAYRLFVYVDDGKGRAGHANIPFLVNNAQQ